MNPTEAVTHDVATSLSHLLAEMTTGMPVATLTTGEIITLYYPAVREGIAVAIALSRGETLPSHDEPM
jgi:hypothetical protein